MNTDKLSPTPKTPEDEADSLDPNDSDREVDKLRGQTTQHAVPARLEDEGQSGG
jgi:hypothetical protein